VTNTLLATLLVDAVILFLVFFLRRRLSPVPGHLQGIVEGFSEFVMSSTEQMAGPRAAMIFPWVAVFFIYILVSNLLGLIPGFGTIGFYRKEGFVPLLHASTADLNTTLAVVSVVATHA
jgi:F-type H+-transporting ATPase subunit a